MTEFDPNERPEETAGVLTAIARTAIERELSKAGAGEAVDKASAQPEPAWLQEPAATFVTLTLDGRLRGCIGTLEAKRSLRADVAANGRAAAFEDPRFPPLTAAELDDLVIEVSVLSEPEPILCRDEAELLAALRPGTDGLVLRCGAHRSTFLPQVWKSLPKPADFVAALKEKALLDRDFWSDEMRFLRYAVEKYRKD